MRLARPPESCKVYTAPALASAMVASLGDDAHYNWLEPSHGTGAFIEALAQHNVERERIVAIDLDLSPCKADALAKTSRGVDFLRWAAQTDQRFDRIVGNPPYVAISQLPTSLRGAAANVTDLSDRPIGNGANVWYAFVLASVRLLKQGGSLAFVLPASAEFADYSAAFRDGLRDQFERLDLFRSDRPLFSEVQEGNLIAIARNYGAPPLRVSRKHFATPEALMDAMANRHKVNGRPCPERSTCDCKDTITFGSVADIRLGGVTGDAKYFLLNEEQRRALDLPDSAFVPVVSRARHLRSSIIDCQEWKSLRNDGCRVLLFCPSETIAKKPAVQKYLRRRVGGCNRSAFKVANRTPWYRTPLPPTPDAFLSGMSQVGPWLCINEMPSLNATNTLYVVSFKSASKNERFGYAISLITTNVRQQLRRAGRRYADGLIKYEPSALKHLRLPRVKDNIDYACLYDNALAALLGGRLREAMRMADSVIAARRLIGRVP